MKTNERTILRRDCQAIQIPKGNVVTLRAGSEVQIMQSLGGTHTVMTNNGSLMRIAEADAAALGKETAVDSLARTSTVPTGAAGVEQLVWDQLRTCFDPEIPVNIVDLGLVYDCQATPMPEGGTKVEVRFTLTAPGCGMGEVLKADIERKIRQLPDVKEVKVEVIFDPPWNQAMMSEAAKLELGLL